MSFIWSAATLSYSLVLVREGKTLNFRPNLTDYVRGGAPVPAPCTYAYVPEGL